MTTLNGFIKLCVIWINIKFLTCQLTEDCGTEYGCFLNPPNCNYQTCISVVKWKDKGNYIDFFVATNSSKISGMTRYNGLGFSNDNYMGNDSISLCRVSIKSFNYVVETYYTSKKEAPDVLNFTIRSLGHFNYSISINQTYLTCQFSRIKYLPNQPGFFNLHLPYYLLLSFGETDSLGSPRYHGVNSYSSSHKVDFQFNSLTIPFLYTNQVNYGLYENEEFTLTWTTTRGQINFELETEVFDTNNVWSAIGFSSDNKMGDDDVCICKMLNKTGRVERYYNKGKERPSLYDSNHPSYGLSNMAVTLNNGLLKCKFTIQMKLTSNYYILTSKGLIDPSTEDIMKHTDAIVSSEKVNFLTNFTLIDTLTDVKITKAKTHGCLMVIGWIFFASVGMFFGRYMKFILPNVKWCGKEVWFFVHRPFMIFVSIISITSFLVILSKCDWKWISTDKPLNYAHSIFGIVTISFGIFQGFVGILRPNRNHPRRKIFNWFHKIMGYSALVFSIVALFLGVFIDEMRLGRVGWGIMIGWTLWCIILPLSVEILKILLKAKQNPYKVDGRDTPKDNDDDDDSFEYEDKNEKQKNAKLNHNFYQKIFDNLKTFLCCLHIFFAFSFTVALVICIGIADDERFYY